MRPATNTQILKNVTGADAATAYRALIMAHENVEAITVGTYISPQPLQERIHAGEFEQEIISKALRLRREELVPFWQAIHIQCLRAGHHSEQLLDAATLHHGLSNLVRLSFQDVDSGGLQTIVTDTTNVAMASLVELSNDDPHHLALMDFRCDVSDENTEIVFAVCRRVMSQGFLLFGSGSSYHACGTALLSPSERPQFLGRCLLFAPIVDANYIAHQLFQPLSSIRISRSMRKPCPHVLRVAI